MHSTIKTAGKRILFSTGHYARRLSRDRFPGVAVLCYHGVTADADRSMPFAPLHVTEEQLDQHCRAIRTMAHPISLHDWLKASNTGAALPARPVLMTFDDGYRSVLTKARPILEQHGIPAIVFACTQPIERRTSLWYDAVARADGEQAVEGLKRATPDRWDAAVARVTVPLPDTDPEAVLRIEDIRALADAGIEIGAHTVSHPILANLPEERQKEEIEGCKESLERWTGREVRAFAYPNGQPAVDYTPTTTRMVRDAGFDSAFTTAPGFAGVEASALELPRFLMMRDVSAPELLHRLAHSWR
jgi:peptidoglycan/xylan/chitin deacetylase (PgdA/CDA1 family)